MTEPIVKSWEFKGPEGTQVVHSNIEPPLKGGEPLVTFTAMAMGIVQSFTMPLGAAQEMAKGLLEIKHEKSLILMPPNTRRPS